MKALVGAFNQEKALVRVFSVIVKSSQTFVSTSRACPQVMSDLLSAWVLSSSSPDPGTGLSSALDQARLGYHAQVTNHRRQLVT